MKTPWQALANSGHSCGESKQNQTESSGEQNLWETEKEGAGQGQT